ncbi:MAG: hypothetical protein GY787_16615 [Alteromonadales bacterium]|jgi:hypothetical protein|nr:hypothetical protein [Alteromonadales bacterium]
MAFKITPPFPIDNTPVYHVDMEDGVLGKANNNGTIIINKDVPCDKIQDVINHEMVHINQMRRGDLDYDDKNVYWKGKVIPRSSIKEGDSALPWEAEAYEKS